MPGTFKCEAVLLAEAGELAYECLATVALPKASDKLKFSVVSADDGSAVQRLLRIPPKNAALEAALNLLLERVPAHMRTKCRSVGQALSKPAGPSPADPNQRPAFYTVEADSPFYRIPSQVGPARLDSRRQRCPALQL